MALDRTLLGVYVDRDVHQRFKQTCEANGITLSFTVDQLLRRLLEWRAYDWLYDSRLATNLENEHGEVFGVCQSR